MSDNTDRKRQLTELGSALVLLLETEEHIIEQVRRLHREFPGLPGSLLEELRSALENRRVNNTYAGMLLEDLINLAGQQLAEEDKSEQIDVSVH